jgi:Domain of unknown function (DUF222)
MYGGGVTVGDVQSYEQTLAQLCAAVDPASIPLRDAVAVYEAAARMEKLAAGLRLRMAARAEASKAWRLAGYRSAAEWLARVAGTSTGVAHAELAASERLDQLPGTTDALRHGTLSAVQATVIADAAAADPSAENRLVVKASRGTVRELREDCARVKAAADPDAEAHHARICRERSVRTFTDHEGAWNLHARGPVEAGAKVMAALQPLVDEVFTEARGEGRRESPEAYGFDALVRLAERPAGGGRANPKYLGLLRVDLEALTRGEVDGEERCEITGLGPVPVRVARQLLGEAVLHLVLTRGRDVAAVVHLGRGPSAAQKLALLWSQPTCSRAGCDQPWTFAEVDHRTPWAVTHRTALHELDRLCRHDHRLKTYHGWALVAGRGKREMVPPGHPSHPDTSHTGTDPPKPATTGTLFR